MFKVIQEIKGYIVIKPDLKVLMAFLYSDLFNILNKV